MSTMLAARAHPQATSLALEQVVVSDLRPDDVLVKVAAAGLAPGMMTLLAMGAFKHLPTTVGHEAAGVVEAVGAYSHRALLGKRVRVHPVLACRNCTYCRTDREQMCRESALIGTPHSGPAHSSCTAATTTARSRSTSACRTGSWTSCPTT